MCDTTLQGIKVAFLTLGCKVNSFETDAMSLLLKEAGAEFTDFTDKADVYLINTCSVTNIADRKSRQMIHKAKKENPDAVVIAAGCYVQALSHEEREKLGVDGIVGNNRKKEIVAFVGKCLSAKKEQRFEEDVTDISSEKEYEEMAAYDSESRTRAFIKIQDGCNQFCSYCIIPYTRGRVRSREAANVLFEARELAKRGFREIVLTGIHLSSYEAYGERGGAALIKLLTDLSQIPEIARLRLGSLEPRVITDEFAKSLSDLPKVCPHFHLSLQSGSDTVLRRMNRKYTTEDYLCGCMTLRKWFDRPAITTDIIVGFPGETEEEFAETMAFAQQVGFSKIHVFKYSRRRGTVADRMNGQIREEIKNERSRMLIELEEDMGRSYARSFIGEKVNVLTEEVGFQNEKRVLAGYTERYVRCRAVTDGCGENEILTAFAEGMDDNVLTCVPESK